MNKFSFVLGLALLCIANAYPADEVAGSNIPGGNIRITDEKKLTELTKNVTDHLIKLGTQENKAFEFIRVHSALYQVVAGIAYKLLVELKENDLPATNCTISLWEKPWENFVKFNVECDEKRKYEYISQEPETSATGDSPVIGGFSQVPESDFTELHTKLAPAFVQLSAENTDFNWTVKRIIEAKSQVVAGSRTLAQLELTNTANAIKKCEAVIWEKNWENFLQVKNCLHKKFTNNYIVINFQNSCRLKSNAKVMPKITKLLNNNNSN